MLWRGMAPAKLNANKTKTTYDIKNTKPMLYNIN